MIAATSSMQRFLKRLLDRSVLSQPEQDAILSLRGRPMQARANVDIVSPGEITGHACLVVDGLVGRFGQLVDGRRQITAFHVAGDMCDLHSVVFPKVGWSLQALTTTTMLEVSHAELRSLARQFPAIAEAFWRDCAVDASILSQWVVNVGRRDARTRLAHVLCEMAVRMEQAGLGSRAVYEARPIGACAEPFGVRTGARMALPTPAGPSRSLRRSGAAPDCAKRTDRRCPDVDHTKVGVGRFLATGFQIAFVKFAKNCEAIPIEDADFAIEGGDQLVPT